MLVPPAWTWRLDFSETNTLCLKTVCNVCMFSICLASRNAIGVRKGINVTAATSASITPSGEALWGMSCCTTYPWCWAHGVRDNRSKQYFKLPIPQPKGRQQAVLPSLVFKCYRCSSFPLFRCNQTGALTIHRPQVAGRLYPQVRRYTWHNDISSFLVHPSYRKIGTLTADMLFSRKRGAPWRLSATVQSVEAWSTTALPEI